MMEPGSPVLAEAPHAWSRSHSAIHDSCYWCRPWEFPAMPQYQTLCCRCGNHIQILIIDPMNEAMEACSTCIDELNADSINTPEREGQQ